MPELTVRDALNQALREEMLRDETVFVLGEEVAYYEGSYKVTRGLLAEFGENRVLDTPIAEEVIVGCAIGAAMGGLRPVAELMTVNFALLAMDQIINHAAKIHYMFGGQVRVPLVLRMPQGAGRQLGAQHSQQLETYFVHCPGLIVLAPATPADARGLLKSAIRDDNPVIFLENQNLYGKKGDVPEGDHLVPIGKAQVARSGSDITLVGYSSSLFIALEAADLLEMDGISAEVIDLRSLLPLDLETILASVEKTHRVIIVSEGWHTANLACEVAMAIQEHRFDELDAPIQRVTARDVPMPYNKTLEQAALPHARDVVEAARRLL